MLMYAPVAVSKVSYYPTHSMIFYHLHYLPRSPSFYISSLCTSMYTPVAKQDFCRHCNILSCAVAGLKLTMSFHKGFESTFSAFSPLYVLTSNIELFSFIVRRDFSYYTSRSPNFLIFMVKTNKKTVEQKFDC